MEAEVLRGDIHLNHSLHHLLRWTRWKVSLLPLRMSMPRSLYWILGDLVSALP